MAFKMKGHSLPGPQQRDTSLTGGVEEHLTKGGQVHPVFNPQYVPGRQFASSEEEEEKKRSKTKHIIRGSGRTHDSFK